MFFLRLSFIAAVAAALGACQDQKTESAVPAAGRPESVKMRALEAGAAALQDTPPVDALNTYLDGFHFYSGRMQDQMEAHHFCSVLNEDVIQCVIFDANAKNAKLMGVEYIISEELFTGLPAGEKSLWHSHVHEVKSGQLVAPGIPDIAERELMEKIVRTYGKTWHTWHTNRHQTLPYGVPQLMMGFTAEGQAHEDMVTLRNQRLGVNVQQEREARASIAVPKSVPGADAWQRGTVVQIETPRGLEPH